MRRNGITTFTVPSRPIPASSPAPVTVRYENGVQITEAKKLSPQKARKMLHDKTVKGHPITNQQRKFFGAVAGGRKPYKEGIERLPWPLVRREYGQTIFEMSNGNGKKKMMMSDEDMADMKKKKKKMMANEANKT